MSTPRSAESAAEAGALMLAAAVRPLDDTAVLEVGGEDARGWLGGQLTRDIKDGQAGDSLYALVVTAKGRILSDLWVLDRGEDRFFLLVPATAYPALVERFDSQIIMEDVTVTQASLRVVTVQGPGSGAVARGVEAWPSDRLGLGGFDVLAQPADLEQTLATLCAAAEPLGGRLTSEAGWELARLRLGRPRFGPDFGETSYPQEAGLGKLAVSFDKGCYVGQEVVCRLESRGKITRRLVTLELEGGANVEAGAELCDGEGAAAGTLTSVAADPEAQVTLALGYVKRALAEPGTELRVNASTARVRGLAG